MKINKITTGFVIQTFDTETGKYTSQEFVAGDDVQYENEFGEKIEGLRLQRESVLPLDMVQPETRKTGEHLFSNPPSDSGGVPRCVTCGCDEDDAHVGGEVCSFVE